MTGGYGRSRWGSGPWGGSERPTLSTVSRFEEPLYPIPYGFKFGRAPVLKFSGLPSSGPIAGRSGLIFFSPALSNPSSTNSVDFAFVGVTVFCSDDYGRPQERSSRLFRFGGGPGFASSNPSRTNAALYRSQPTEYTAVATLVQTIPPGPTTVIKIP